MKHRPSKAVNVRPLYGAEAEDKWLERLRCYGKEVGDSPSLAVGSHLGCHLLGAGRSNNRLCVLHARRPMETLMSALDLVEDGGESSSIRLVEPSFPEGVLGGRIFAQGIPVVDLLQCYLDVRISPARGLEQADYIWQRILSKHVGGG